MRGRLVGLSGKKRAGKDTYASGLGFARVALADKLKEMALLMDPLVVERETFTGEVRFVRLSEIVRDYGWERAKEVPEVRRTLQFIGVAVREMDQDFWIRQVSPAVEELLSQGKDVVVTDIRFPNEADWIHAWGGHLIKLVRPGSEDGDTHVSENALEDREYTFTVLNNGTVEDLLKAAAEQARWLVRADAVLEYRAVSGG